MSEKSSKKTSLSDPNNDRPVWVGLAITFLFLAILTVVGKLTDGV